MTARFTVMTLLTNYFNISQTFLLPLISFSFHLLCFFFCFFCVKAKHGYRNLTGIDYSSASVELARKILEAEDLTDVTVKVGSVMFVIKTIALHYC